MSGIGVVWSVVKMAATRIPWGRVLENAPAVVDLVARAKDRLNSSAQEDLEERLRLIQEENLKLEEALQANTEQLKKLAATLKVVAARQKLLMTGTVLSLLAAVSALILWLVK